jgi:hypothetical protein
MNIWNSVPALSQKIDAIVVFVFRFIVDCNSGRGRGKVKGTRQDSRAIRVIV